IGYKYGYLLKRRKVLVVPKMPKLNLSRNIRNVEGTMDITEFFRKLKCVCHWADPFKDLKWSNVPGVKLSSFSKSDGTFLSLQALSDLYYLFGGFLDYLWSLTSSTDSQMHNNIIAAGSRDSPPMLATRRYPGPYKPTTVLVQAVAATDDSPAILEHTIVETPMNMSPENKVHFQAEKEVIHLILTGIGDEIYLTVDACQTAQEMWEAIERKQRTVNVAGARENVGSPSEFVSNTCLVETNDSNVIPNSPDMCNDIQNDQNDVESDDERVELANLIANLKLDIDENKKI
nr:hypothetical protein [Tanacetum cinerariifolium]